MQEPFDVLSQGTKLGALRYKKQIRVLICYLLNSVRYEISKEGLDEIVQRTSLVNFFEWNDTLRELVASGFVSERKDGEKCYYAVTAEGAKFADDLDVELPFYVREEIIKEAIGIVSREKMRGSVETKIDKLEQGCHVTLSVLDEGDIMMQTVLYTADELQAEHISETFMKDPVKFYSGIVDLITE